MCTTFNKWIVTLRLYTIDFSYIVLEYNIILKTIHKEESWNFIETMNSWKTPSASTFWTSYGTSFLSSLDKRYQEILRMHCIWLYTAGLIYHFYLRKHENMSKCTGCKVNTSYERTFSCAGTQFRMLALESKAPVTQDSTSKSRTRSYENLVDVVVSGNFWSILAWPCFVTGYGRRRLFHCWSTT